MVILLRDLAHGYAEVTAPHRFVRDEFEIPDQRLEFEGFGEDRDRPDLHPEGEDLRGRRLERAGMSAC